ncbi:hypothetical protein OEW28_13265 [Defluviimonas sp. WL0002]|uniref:Uncharacterized protein n=1 Tax=Albidovulum marisflavi TaxID=2984159 RepID=A0ABT2ZEX8_9RHOB|nr:hypothetical protein [Defluviimonas sp. WL0002]MCV2869598.1 hypothetical protein [Defluviimonas sp. WL0002]
MTDHSSELAPAQPLFARMQAALSTLLGWRAARTAENPSPREYTSEEWARLLQEARGDRADNLILSHHPAALIGWMR